MFSRTFCAFRLETTSSRATHFLNFAITYIHQHMVESNVVAFNAYSFTKVVQGYEGKIARSTGRVEVSARALA